MALSTRPPSRGRPMTVSSTSRSVRSLATASRSGTSPFIGTSLEDVTMIRPGAGVTSSRGRNTVWSTPTGTTVMRSGRTSICAAMSRRDDSRDRQHRRQGARHPHLHAQKAEPTPGREALPGIRGVGQGELAVHGDRMVQGGQQRPAVVDHAQHPGAQALVVVDDVEVAAPARQQRPRPLGEGQRLPEPGGAHDAELDPVLAGRELPRVGHPEGVGIAVEIEPGTGVNPTPGSSSGHGGPANTSTECPRATSSRVRWRV